MLAPAFVWMEEQIQLKNNLVLPRLWFPGVVHLKLAQALEAEMKGQGEGRTSRFSSTISLY